MLSNRGFVGIGSILNIITLQDIPRVPVVAAYTIQCYSEGLSNNGLNWFKL